MTETELLALAQNVQKKCIQSDKRTTKYFFNYLLY